MTTEKNHPICSSEYAALWMIYEKKTMVARVLEYFLTHVDEQESKRLMTERYTVEKQDVETISTILRREGAPVPVGFTELDVHLDAPPLFDHMFDIMYLRTMSKVATGLHALYTTVSYREDIIDLFKKFTREAEEMYKKTTQLLLDKGVLARSPYVDIPSENQFVKDKTYMSGFSLFNDKRTLNVVEVALIYQSIESNVMGMQLMTGFSQVTDHEQVRNYFFEGKELAKKIVTELGGLLLQSDIQTPATWAGKATRSTIAPFSNKLMMYNTSLLSSFGLTSNALGTSFSLRSDLPLKMANLSRNIFNYAKKGGKLMIENGWMEKPPQMEERSQVIQGKRS
ncbi:MAG TPA: DUF3231 family protein [Bacillales bacterium]|nr:DUF3231 family protein [Bacillales bacterium]